MASNYIFQEKQGLGLIEAIFVIFFSKVGDNRSHIRKYEIT